jgi:hypothetical protein
VYLYACRISFGLYKVSFEWDILPKAIVPVSEAACHVAAVDVVELGRIDPLVFHVVDLEFDIRRHKGRLDRTDVVAKNFCRGVLLRLVVMNFHTGKFGQIPCRLESC